MRARNQTVSWKAVASDGLDVVPARGSIRPGGTAVIWVTVHAPGAAGSGTVTITSNGGGSTCELHWDDTTTPTSLPEDDVTASAEATDTPAPEAAVRPAGFSLRDKV
ncbi:hypothetical protein OUY22_25225 [Nonomuraea sp. MCN248]|uniref:Uncharacterized protein n=1 Tax=Nonomuraea corallina TaxID=2989783 RepID=A0ABT4SHW4_9ACTN|nr:hypothetical protein [Nonomuraea corallina]MDA0636724.1 hypothetical protein [Nonomuraea corallina]